MNPDTIKEMNNVLDVANVIIEEDAALANKTKYPATATYTGSGEDLSDDYKVARDTLKGLISSGEFALTKMEKVLIDSDAPRTFEVFSTLIKSIADLTGDLIKLQKHMKDIATPIIIEDNNKKNSDTLEITTDQLNKLLNKAAEVK